MIKRVLVANRGEIAIRVFHTLREMGLRSVAIYTAQDAESLHVRMADESYPVESYLNIPEILRAAQESGAHAIHPGYGFLSENARFSAACEEAGITFVGPRPDTIATMGDKLESKRMMQAAGVPVVPMWTDTPPDSAYPVLVKAVGGGGGKGMRLVRKPSELPEALASASREAAKAFSNDKVFVEKYVDHPRHIEFQIIGDAHGNFIHLFERECSIQRRHQKIIEETPSVALTPELRERMGAAAVAAARATGYLGAGTVEFILGPDGDFYFLEMNTRLQVEHPVTEMTTGTDLVREQMLIASGAPTSIQSSQLKQTGHSIECRIYAEVPEENFRPSIGTIEIYEPPVGPGVRLDSGVRAGSNVTFHYDPMLAKLIVWAPSRQAAIARMDRALSEFVIIGVEHNIDFLRRVIATEDFAAGRIDTHFLERHAGVFLRAEPHASPEALLAASLGARSIPQRASAGHDAPERFPDVWTSGHWRNS